MTLILGCEQIAPQPITRLGQLLVPFDTSLPSRKVQEVHSGNTFYCASRHSTIQKDIKVHNCRVSNRAYPWEVFGAQALDLLLSSTTSCSSCSSCSFSHPALHFLPNQLKRWCHGVGGSLKVSFQKRRWIWYPNGFWDARSPQYHLCISFSIIWSLS